MYKMHYRLLFMLLAISTYWSCSNAQHEDIPYEDIENICEKCNCLTAQDADKRYHHLLSCTSKNFKHILARWPEEFGRNHNGMNIVATFSGNSIKVLQQLPATNATLSFSCRHCAIKLLQSPTFMDVPNIQRLDLSWNELTADELTPDVFRGPFRTTHYEPIALQELDLSHNKLTSLNRKIFEHTPYLVKLNVSFNELLSLYPQVLMMVPKLEILDLAYTGLNTLPTEFSTSLRNLKQLSLAGNYFTVPPAELQHLGLRSLNFADNSLIALNESDFIGLQSLRRLNISNNRHLKTISNDAFIRLISLENLYCSHNPSLEQFNLNSLTRSRNLTELDISYCSITSLSLNTSFINQTSSKLWPRLRSLKLKDNPLLCDCELLETLEYIDVEINEPTRCDTPYIFSGAQLTNLTAEKICSMQIPKKYRVVDEDPPRFLRKRYVIFTLITASIVIGIGLIIGFGVGYVRRRLKRDDFGVEPIRYTSVRCSTLSAFSNPQSLRSST